MKDGVENLVGGQQSSLLHRHTISNIDHYLSIKKVIMKQNLIKLITHTHMQTHAHVRAYKHIHTGTHRYLTGVTVKLSNCDI